MTTSDNLAEDPKSSFLQSLVTTASGLQYGDVKKTGGPIVKPEQDVRLSYRVALDLEDLIYSRNILDSSIDNDVPLIVKLGEGKLLSGLEEGIVGMGRGDTRWFIIPPHLAFNKRGIPGIIPQDANLYVEIYVSTKI